MIPGFTPPAEPSTSHHGFIRRAGGFTLLEILIALALMTLIMLGVWSTMHGVTKIIHSADALLTRSESVNRVQQFLRRDISAAVRLPDTDCSTQGHHVAFAGGPNSMCFVGSLPWQSGHTGLYVQNISLSRGSKGETSLWLAYKPYRGGVPEATPSLTHLLLPDLQGGSLQYLGIPAKGKPPTWQGHWVSTDLPLAVKIRLDSRSLPRSPFPNMTIPVYAGNSQEEQP